MNFRTDLALERQEYIKSKTIDGVESSEETKDNVKITTISVTNPNGEKAIGKPMGKYVTLEISSLMKNSSLIDCAAEVLAPELKKLLPGSGVVLVVGLGNEKITPDALGPKCISLMFATRHIGSELAKSVGLGRLRSVAAIAPGVLGQTGIETAEVIEAVAKKINPAAVVIIDALASRRLSRLGTTVQMSDTGISPGSGVGNRRVEISKKTLGIPVVAMGVPTVVDGATMAYDLLEEFGIDPENERRTLNFKSESLMMVTPKEIDLLIERSAELIAMGINCAMQPDLSAEDLLALVK